MSTYAVEATMGVRGDPVLTRVARHAAMPHYTMGHLDRVAAAVESLARMPTLVLAGAAARVQDAHGNRFTS